MFAVVTCVVLTLVVLNLGACSDMARSEGYATQPEPVPNGVEVYRVHRVPSSHEVNCYVILNANNAAIFGNCVR